MPEVTHNIRITPVETSLSGKMRYRVECVACAVVVHEATTGPLVRLREHWEGMKGYERPMTEEEIKQLGIE